MDRRASGVALLLFALVAGLVVPRLLHPRHVDGVAAAEPPAPPLVVGDCLRDGVPRSPVNDRGAPLPPGVVVTVSCDRAHGAEVVLIADPADGSDGVIRQCVRQLVTRWGLTDDALAAWEPRLDVDLGLAAPDTRQQAAGQRWTACAVGPTQTSLDRPLAAAPPGVGPPPEFALCSRTQAGSDSEVTVPCTEHHTVETLGRLTLEAGSDVTQAALDAARAALVAAASGRADLLREPGVSMEAPVYATFLGNSQPVVAPLPQDATGGWATCLVRTVGDRELTGSVRRLGDAPLPWVS